MTEHDALLAIQDCLDGVYWSADTCNDIAEIMVRAGFKIREPE